MNSPGPLPTFERLARDAGQRMRTARPPGLRGRLWVTYVIQVLVISAATALSVYGAYLVLRDVLIERALVEEAVYYRKRVAADPAASLPDTYNMQSYLARDAAASTVPERLRGLSPGYHAVGRDLVYVSDGAPGRLFLVFAQQQVERLALWFGFLPLVLVLGAIYLMTWTSYRATRRAVSPLIWLANQVRDIDPKSHSLDMIDPDNLPADADAEVRQLTAAIHGYASRLEEFVERERNFTRDASHELRSPLTVIKVAADVLADDEAQSPFNRRSLERIKRATRDMEALIEAFLILAREGDVGLPEEDFDVATLVDDEVERAQDLVSGKPVTVAAVHQAHFDLHAPPRVVAVMLSNLLRNACAYTEQGTVTVTVGPRTVQIDDTGVGMSAEEVANAFKPFFRGRGTGKGGHGVGLTIVKRLSDRFGWPIELASEAGVGTRATIRFPQATLR